MRFRFVILTMLIIILIVLGITVYRRGYFITDNFFTKGISLNSRNLVSMLRERLIDDNNRIVWWKLKFSDKIEIKKNNLQLWKAAPGGNVVIGCAKNEIILGGHVKKVEILINPNLWKVDIQNNLNIVFVKCSLLSYEENYQNSVAYDFVDLFNKNQFILKK